METGIETNFDNILAKLVNRFESNPYSLSPSEIQMLKWFSQNPGYLGKSGSSTIDSVIRTGIVTAFVKKKMNDDKIK